MSAKPLLPAHDKLSEALLGLTLLALDRPREEHKRLVAQFMAQYPEIDLVPPGYKSKTVPVGGYFQRIQETATELIGLLTGEKAMKARLIKEEADNALEALRRFA